MNALSCRELFSKRPEWIHGPSCIDGISVSFRESLLHGIVGKPGSGKTLLLHLLGLLEPPDRGVVEVFGEPIATFDNDVLHTVRNHVFGYLFTSACLLPSFTVAENVAMPLFRFSATQPEGARQQVGDALKRFGIDSLAGELAGNLDGSLAHMVSLVRSVIHNPRILVAIVPSSEAPLIFPLVRSLVDESGMTCLWAQPGTGPPFACDRELQLAGGRVVRDEAFVG